ncbi:pectinesterase family protein [Pedobacter sp. SYSU D00535]|uniref:pectinesterase family protein n=1 Tax=Pedobacter sp. SYSU D00535 TaxID=2810308 RepID=UPI001A96FAFE|nr:pectinesterase family protein [Pedobacter sp. SYSU D00535]
MSAIISSKFEKPAVKFLASAFTLLFLLVFPFFSSGHSGSREKGLVAQEELSPDIVVARDGSGNFTTVGDALASLNTASTQRIVIFIKEGIYHERVVINRPNVTLVGESRKGTRIQFHLASGSPYRGVLNIMSDGVVLKNLTVANVFPTRRHTFTLYGLGSKVVTVDCDFVSNGNDTVALWNEAGGMFYHANCHFEGNADFLCPHGWCYITNSTIFEVGPHAPLWHDGSKNPNQKFVITNSKITGATAYPLGKYPRDHQFYLINAVFSANTKDIRDDNASETPSDRFKYGRRVFFHNSHKLGGDSAWHANNLHTAPAAPRPEDITAKWTFDGMWDPERTDQPKVTKVEIGKTYRTVDVTFSEPLTVRGNPVLRTKAGKELRWTGINGSAVLRFALLGKGDSVDRIELVNGAIFASEPTVKTRHADLKLK